MRVLVTGRDGQVATALASLRLPEGVEIVTAGRPELDLDRPETVGPAVRAARPDVVVSAAAYTAVDQAEGERDAAFRANADSPGELARAARALGAPVLHLSTDYVFDGAAGPYREGDPTGPRSVYGASKLAGEAAVLDAQPESLVLRTAWVHAPWGKNFVRTMLRLAETRDEVGVVADQRGSPTYAPDIAEALLTLAGQAQRREGPFGVRHMAGGGETTWAGFAEAIFQGARARGAPAARVRPIATADYPTPAPRPADSRLDCAALARDGGVRLPAWEDGLRRGLDALLGPVRHQEGASAS
jgi:dTDP-4-dehydrorhamnose reductase